MAETKSHKMDLSELTKIIVDRILKLDPANVGKIMGFILLKEPCEQEMLKLAFGPENSLVAMIAEAKTVLGLLSPNNPKISSHNPFPQNLAYTPRTHPDSIREEDYSLCVHAQLLNLEEKIDSSSSVGTYYYCKDASFNGGLSSQTSRRSPSLPEFPIKACHYFYKGYCKHGANCRYYHGHSQDFCSNFNDSKSEENGFSLQSLEKLEMEITDLLKSRRGAPVSISLLPMLYYEKYGRSLQADGYLTESQRHGKAGFSLTKLLARLKNSIHLIDGPHGQHSVILAEDAPKYLECRRGRSEPMGASSSSYQIYLTFPADSSFNEDDVSGYFEQFGPVTDVRIPCEEKKMFGFVSFLHTETVSEILMMRNVHYICGSRVLVKPYKEKTSAYIGKNKLSMRYPNQYPDLDSEFSGIPRKNNSTRMVKLHLEERRKMVELERSGLARFNLAQEHLEQQPWFNHGVDGSKLLLEDRLSFSQDGLNAGSSGFVRTRNKSNNYSEKESGRIELPDNPFASPPSVGGGF